MRILVCGSRHFDDWLLLSNTLQDVIEDNLSSGSKVPEVVTIIEGGAKGADFLARTWAKRLKIPFEEYPADWKKHGKAAGPIRNRQMVTDGKPDLVVAFLAPDSRGTKDMVKVATEAGVPVKIVEIANEKETEKLT